jgi:Tol biopolymer transport system component
MRAALIALAATLLLATPANAAIVFERGAAKPSVYIAGDDGTGARRLAAGNAPHLSPDGTAVTYLANASGSRPELREIPAAGGASKLLLRPYRYGVFAWSPDGRYIAAQTGPLNGKQQLALIDRATGTTRTVATGSFTGASFSPASDKLVYGFATRLDVFAPTNLQVAPVAGGAPAPLTSDGRSGYPVWGPQKIAFTHWQRPPRKQDGPKFNLWLLNPDGSGRTRLTNDKVPFLLSGLTPVEWSADGTRLLAQFGGQDTAYVVTVDPATGKEKVIGSKSEGFFGTGLSADGSTILGSSGGFEWAGRAHIVTAPYTGGKTTTLISSGDSPDWNR